MAFQLAFQYQVCCDHCKAVSQQASPNTLPSAWLSLSVDDDGPSINGSSPAKELNGEKTFCSVDCMVSFVGTVYLHHDASLVIRTTLPKGGKFNTQNQQGKTS